MNDSAVSHLDRARRLIEEAAAPGGLPDKTMNAIGRAIARLERDILKAECRTREDVARKFELAAEMAAAGAYMAPAIAVRAIEDLAAVERIEWKMIAQVWPDVAA
jgi:hypothetical protein